LPDGPESTQAENQLRREMHNATEKRRREKINSKIAELRDLIPSAKNFGNNKSSVLQTAVEHIKQLNANYNQLLAANRQLQETNTQLLNELRELHRLLWTRARDQGQILLSLSLFCPPFALLPSLSNYSLSRNYLFLMTFFSPTLMPLPRLMFFFRTGTSSWSNSPLTKRAYLIKKK
jgi:hypothetical protein